MSAAEETRELTESERAEVERFGIHEPEIIDAALEAVAAATVPFMEAMRAAAEVMVVTMTSLNELLIFLESLVPRKARRRLKKKAKLVAHYQSKIDRIPSWKRVQS